MADRPSILDEVADMISPLNKARAYLDTLDAKERAEWDELLRRGDLYPGAAVVKVFARRGIELDRHTCHKLRVETEGYVPAR